MPISFLVIPNYITKNCLLKLLCAEYMTHLFMPPFHLTKSIVIIITQYVKFLIICISAFTYLKIIYQLIYTCHRCQLDKNWILKNTPIYKYQNYTKTTLCQIDWVAENVLKEVTLSTLYLCLGCQFLTHSVCYTTHFVYFEGGTDTH